jgi:hypothetical protein
MVQQSLDLIACNVIIKDKLIVRHGSTPCVPTLTR